MVIFRLVLTSIVLLVAQVLLFLVFEFFGASVLGWDPGDVYFLYTRTNIVILSILYLVAHSRLKIGNLQNAILLSLFPLLLMLLPLFIEDALKVRLTDALYFLLFILVAQMLWKQKPLTKAAFVSSFSVLVFVTYIPFYHYIYFKFITEERALAEIPSFQMVDAGGSEVEPFRIRNKAVFLNIWNKSCGSCIRKFPKIRQLEEHFENDTNVIIRSLYGSLDPRDSKSWFFDTVVQRFSRDSIKMAFSDEPNFALLKIRTFPQYIIINTKGEASLYSDLDFNVNSSESVYSKIKRALQQ